MTDTDLEADGLPGVAAPAPTDSFTAVAALLALIVDARACQARLRELRTEHGTVEKSKAELATERSEFDKFATGRAGELDEKSAELRKRELALAIREGQCAHREEVAGRLERERRGRELEHFPGGLTRERDQGRDQEPDPHFRAAEDHVFHEPVEQRAARKSMRRGIDAA